MVDNGSDMTMIVSGILLKKALDAAAILKEQGIGVRVLDMATIKPLDKEAVLKAAGETGAIMTIEDHSIFGGLGSAVAEVVVGNCPVPMEIVGLQDRFGESGDPELIYLSLIHICLKGKETGTPSSVTLGVWSMVTLSIRKPPS